MSPIISTITSGLALGRTPPQLSYEMSASSTTLDETSNRLTTFTVVTENVQPGTVLYYTLSGTGISNADFVSGSTFGNFTITNNSGTFQIETATDYLSEGQETVTVSLRLGSIVGSVVATQDVIVQDTSINPIFTVAPSTGSINESQSLNFTVFTDLPVEQTIYYTFAGTIEDEDTDVSAGIGSVQIGGIAGTTKVINVGITSDYLTEGTESFAMQVRRLEPAGSIATTSSLVTISDTSTTPIVTVTPSSTSISEGDTVTFTVTTSGSYRVGDTFYWTVNTTGSSLDFSTPMSGSFVIPGSATNTVNITTIADQTTEGSETFTLQVRRGSTSGEILGTSATVTINDTSQDPTYAIAGPASIDEDATGTINVTTQYVFDATVLYWDLSNTTDFDTATSGSVTISSNAASFNVTPTRDRTTEGSETFTARLYSDSGRTNLLAESANITINDTSEDPTFSVSGPTSIDEGSSATFNIATTEVDNGTVLYWDITNSGDFDSGTSGSATISSSDGGLTGTASFTTGTATEDSTSEGAETFTASIYSDSGRTNLLATSSNVTINDTSVPLIPEFRIKYHGYGSTIGVLEVWLEPANNPGTLVQQTFTYNDGNNSGTFMSGAQQTSSAAAYKELKLTPSSDGRLYLRYRSGSSYTGDFAFDDEAYLYQSGSLAATLYLSPSYPTHFQRHNNPGATTMQSASDSLYETISSVGANGDWKYDSGGTPSGSTGPNYSPTGLYYVFAETSGTGAPSKYFMLRTNQNLTAYLP